MILTKRLDLPKIPESLINRYLETLHTLECRSVFKSFNSYPVSEEIEDFCGSVIFRMPIVMRYALIYHDVPIHTDTYTTFSVNYLVIPGANTLPITRYYDSDKKTVLGEFVLEPHNWYYFKTNVLHTVDGIDGGKIRTSFRIYPKDKTKWQTFASQNHLCD